jgi:hypothetical protein
VFFAQLLEHFGYDEQQVARLLVGHGALGDECSRIPLGRR